jgi:hypothetical protein
MEIWLIGNPDLEEDNLPLKLLPDLKKRLPGVSFVVKDPNDEWDDIPDPLIIIDTVQGIKEVTVFTDLSQFQSTPHVTVHDFDLGMKLRWLQKLGKLPSFFIMGVPMNAPPQQTLEEIHSSCVKSPT